MRAGRIALLAALPAAALSLAPAATSSSAAAPLLRFVDLSPATARGAHFAPGTRVRVTLVAGQTKLSRVVSTSSRGAFVVGFGSVPREDRCSGKMILLASAASGQRASYRLPALNCTTWRVDELGVVGVAKPAIVGAVDRAGVGAADKSSTWSTGSTGASR